MISTQFDYVCAQTLDEALTLLAQNEDAKILARRAQPDPAMNCGWRCRLCSSYRSHP